MFHSSGWWERPSWTQIIGTLGNFNKPLIPLMMGTYFLLTTLTMDDSISGIHVLRLWYYLDRNSISFKKSATCGLFGVGLVAKEPPIKETFATMLLADRFESNEVAIHPNLNNPWMCVSPALCWMCKMHKTQEKLKHPKMQQMHKYIPGSNWFMVELSKNPGTRFWSLMATIGCLES